MLSRKKELLKLIKGNYSILIYQMGKVGSTSIYSSLIELKLDNSIFHVHALTPTSIEKIKNKAKLNGQNIPSMYYAYRNLLWLKKIPIVNKKWHYITVLRDPIATALSHFFHNPQRHQPQIVSNHELINNAEIEKYMKIF